MSLPIRIVLVDTSHPGNIGAVARAMKNMGLAELHLVRPRLFPDAEATARASGADDVLEQARVHDSLEAAVHDCGLVAGTTARSRHMPFVFLEPRECAALAVERAGLNRVALVFGAERTGLSNTELSLCNVLVTIPTAGIYSSLNLAMAVQILCYEVLLAARGAPTAKPLSDEPLATIEEMERFYAHLDAVLAGSHFRDHTSSGHLMSRVRRIFNRAQLDQNEMRILRGILSAVQMKQGSLSNSE